MHFIRCKEKKRLTWQEAESPQARMKVCVDAGALVERHDDPFLEVEPIISANSYAQQAQATHCEHTAQQGQRFPATHTHTTNLLQAQ